MDLGTYFLISTAERENHREAREKRETVPPIKATSGCIKEYAVAPDFTTLSYPLNTVCLIRLRMVGIYSPIALSESYILCVIRVTSRQDEIHVHAP